MEITPDWLASIGSPKDLPKYGASNTIPTFPFTKTASKLSPSAPAPDTKDTSADTVRKDTTSGTSSTGPIAAVVQTQDILDATPKKHVTILARVEEENTKELIAAYEVTPDQQATTLEIGEEENAKEPFSEMLLSHTNEDIFHANKRRLESGNLEIFLPIASEAQPYEAQPHESQPHDTLPSTGTAADSEQCTRGSTQARPLKVLMQTTSVFPSISIQTQQFNLERFC